MTKFDEIEMTGRPAGEIARIQLTDLHQLYPPEAGCTDWIAEPRGNGVPRMWSGRQVMLLALHADLVRFGMPIPRAGKLVARIAEALALALSEQKHHLVNGE